MEFVFRDSTAALFKTLDLGNVIFNKFRVSYGEKCLRIIKTCKEVGRVHISLCSTSLYTDI